jgi:aromatic-L-amino-acid decarboxylase
VHLLVIGGTRFTGRHLAAEAVARGHRVTLFHRGSTAPELLAEAGVAHVLGDRTRDVSTLAAVRPDAVVDLCGYAPRTVAATAEALADAARYVFVSTVSVYARPRPGDGEDAATVEPLWPEPADEAVTEHTYGPMKVACEAEVTRVFGERAAIVRPGFIVGPWDPSDRLPALLRRAATRPEVLVPGDLGDPLQFVDARDLAAFLLDLAEGGEGGVYDAVHPRGTTTLGEVLALAGSAAPVAASLPWLRATLGDDADAAFPLWDPEQPAMHARSGARAARAGLRTRPVTHTVADTLAWDADHPERRKDALPEDRERTLIAAWRRRSERDVLASTGGGLEPSSAALRTRTGQLLDHLLPWLERMPTLPVARLEGSRKLARRLLGGPWPEEGATFPSLLAALAPGLDRSLQTTSPGYLAYIPGGGLPDAALADMYALLTNRYTTLAMAAPTFAAVEEQVIRWFCALVGYGEDAGGVLLSGGSLANLVGVVTARDALRPPLDRARIYASEQAHHSVRKAALVAGLGDDAVVTVPTDAAFRTDPGALAARIDADRAAGLAPFLVVGNAGATATGAVDDLAALAAVAHARGCRLHVDAAYGGFFLLTERGRAALAGIAEADSVALDPHKSLFFPYGTGAVVVRDRAALRRAHTVRSSYLPVTDGEDGWDFADLSPELSREARGVRVWLPLMLHGRRAFAAALDEKLDLARSAADRIRALPGVRLVSEPTLSLFSFRLEDEASTRRWLSRTNQRGRVFLTGATVHDPGLGTPVFAVRVCVLCLRTHRPTIDALVEDLASALPEAYGAGP